MMQIKTPTQADFNQITYTYTLTQNKTITTKLQKQQNLPTTCQKKKKKKNVQAGPGHPIMDLSVYRTNHVCLCLCITLMTMCRLYVIATS